MSIDRTKLARTDGKIVKAEDFSALTAAKTILAEARQHAADISQHIQSERETAIKVGAKLGREQARAEYAQSMVEATSRMESTFIVLEARLVKTVMDALEGILHEIGDTAVMEKLVRRTIANVEKRSSLRLIVASSQFDMVNHLLTDILKNFPEVQYIDVVKDPTGAPGMCILESEFGTVDASLETQIAAVRAGLINAFIGKRNSSPPNVADN